MVVAFGCDSADEEAMTPPPPDSGRPDMAPQVCGAPIPASEACSPELDCCEAGARCIPDLLGGICLRDCDANAVESGCEEAVACIPASEVLDPNAPAPGFCFPGDGCQPGLEEEACEGPSTCAIIEPASYCLGAGERGLGEACGATNDPASLEINCEAGLFCAYGTCAAPCGEGCGAPERCVDLSESLDGQPFDFCYGGCDPFAQDCAEEEICAPVGVDAERRAVAACVEGTAGVGTQAETCEPNALGYWGDCTPGHLCRDLFGVGRTSCAGFCDSADRSLCGAGSACVPDLLVAGLGLCLGECQILGADSGCGEERLCQFTGMVGADLEGRDRGVGLCLPGPQTASTGETCEVNDQTGAHHCETGHICGRLSTQRPTECIKLCESDPSSEHGCPTGSQCRVDLFGGDESGDGASTLLGACVPVQI